MVRHRLLPGPGVLVLPEVSAGQGHAHPVSLHHRRLSAHVIQIRVGHHQQIQAAVPEGHGRAQLAEEQLRTVSPVHQHLAARGRLDQDAISLADVQEGDVQAAIRLGEGQAPEQDPGHGHGAERGRAEDPPCPGSGRAETSGLTPLEKAWEPTAPLPLPPPGLDRAPPGEEGQEPVGGAQGSRPVALDLQAGPGQGRRPPDHAHGPGQAQPGDPEEQLGHRGEAGQASQDARATPEHDEGLHRRDEQVGEQADQAQAAEVVDHQGQGGQVGGQGDQQPVLEQTPEQGAAAGGQAIPHSVLGEGGPESRQPAAELGREEDEARGGRAAQLEAHVPQGQGIEQGHGPAGRGQADQGRGLALQGSGHHEEAAHEGCPHHRGIAAHQQRVEADASQGGEQGPAPPEQAHAEGHEHPGDEGHVAAGDDDHVAGAGQVELVVELVRDAGLDAQEHAVGQGRVGLGQEPLQEASRPGPERVEPTQQGRALVGAGQGLHPWAVHHAVDALAGQVGPVVEAIEDRRVGQPSTGLHRLAVDEARAATARFQAQKALHSPGDPVPAQLRDPQVQGLAPFLHHRVVDHHALDRDGGQAAVEGPVCGGVVPGQILGRPTGLKGMAGIAQ